MAATSPAPSSKLQWWARASSKTSSLRLDKSDLFAVQRGSLMTPVTTTKNMSSNSFATSSTKSPSSRFNFSAVLPSFASRSKKQLHIQDPPSQVRSLPIFKSSSSRHPADSSSSTKNSRVPRSTASSISVSAISRASASTDGHPDSHSPSGRLSCQNSLITLADSNDPLPPNLHRNERRVSAQSDMSIGKRLMSKVDPKSKASARPPTDDAPTRKNSRDRSATLPSKVRSATDASDAYQPLRAVEPPWQPSSSPDSPGSPTMVSLHSVASDQSGTETPRADPSSNNLLRKAKDVKSTFPWPDTRPGSASLQEHRRTESSTSLAKDRSESRRTSMSSTTRTASSVIPQPFVPTSPTYDPRTLTPTAPSTPLSRPPRPPPTQELPPTPGSSKHTPARSEIRNSAPTTSTSFVSSLSSLSFTNRSSPRDPPAPQSYPSLLAESLPGDTIRRTSDSGSSLASAKSASVSQRVPSTGSTKSSLKPGSRPLPEPPRPRERTQSSTSSIGDSGDGSPRILRKQRSFHNTSLHVPTPRTPTLRHYNSFDPMTRSPPEPSHPPPNEPPPLPPSSPSNGKRGSGSGKESISPRRRLFSSHKHDRKQEQEHHADPPPTTAPLALKPAPTSPLAHSWYDESNASIRSGSPPPVPDVSQVVPQHIVPPAELLRLGITWERESESLRKAAARPTSRLPPPPRSATGSPPSPPWASSKLPRSASMFSKSSFSQSFTSADSPAPSETYTSLSPPPRRARPVTATSRRTLSNASTPPNGIGGGLERKPSFLDMTTRRSVSIELPEQRDSFLELSRGVDSIDTIRESEVAYQ